MQNILELDDTLEQEGLLEFHEDGSIPADALLPRPVITDFCIELAKARTEGLCKEVSLLYIVFLLSCHL